ncbi:MAG: Do family serine endopeptidase [Rhodospirillales bacterium]|nr:Do family serine endopeptidase [Rhodospirillales bacterium]
MTRRYGIFGWVAAAILVALISSTASLRAAEKATPTTAAEIQLSFAPLVKAAAPAVVNIYTRKVVRTRQSSPLFNDPFFRRFFGRGFGFDTGRTREKVQNSLGSGVIVDEKGVIVTNHHVVEGADEITVVLADRREFDASLVGSDERSDLAVLQVETDGEKLPFLKFRDSDELEVGDLVLAIGNPFGVGQTVTSGIVSAMARTRVGVSDLSSFIQTDAAINPGNSGGALITMDGFLVGINTAIFSKSGGSHGIGFAIPGNMARSVLAGLTGEGGLVRPWLGAWGQPVSSDIAASLGMSRPVGVLVNNIYPNGPAQGAGLKLGDVIVAVGGKSVVDPQALRYRIATLAVGQSVDLSVWRRGRETTLKLGLTAPRENPPRELTELTGRHPLLGASIVNMSPALAEELGIDPVTPGVFVLQIRRGGSANRLGFRPGDRIVAINDENVGSVSQLKVILAKPAQRWRVTLERNGKTLNWVIEA